MEQTTKILIIDDSKDLREDVVEILSLEGYQTVSAENGAIGVQVALKERPDLILCDIMMPGLDGYEVLEALRQDERTAAIPFIFLTARTERLNVRQGMVLGADDYLTKPFRFTELLDSIKTQLRKRTELNEVARNHLEALRQSIRLALPHELRNPLNIIIGFSDLLKSEAQRLKPDQVYDWAASINESAHYLSRLFENYLFYNRLSFDASIEDKRHADHPTLEFAFIIEMQALRTAQMHQRTDQLDIELEDAEDIHIHETDLRKLVEELVDNAFKFSETDTQVIIRGTSHPEYYELVIQDFGEGLTPEQAEQAGAYMQFERWIREQQGLGLGLAIVKLLLNLYDYQWQVDGTKDSGTKITVHIKRG